MLGEVAAARLHLSGVLHRITHWKVWREEEASFAELHFQGCNVANRGASDNVIQLQEGVEGELFYFTVYRCLDVGGYEAGLILTPYQDGFVRVGFMKFQFGYMVEGSGFRLWERLGTKGLVHVDPLWGGGKEQEIFLY